MKRLKYITFIILTFLYCRVAAQTPKEVGLIHHAINDKQLGDINFYVTDTLHSLNKPVLLYLDGSGDSPLFTYRPGTNGTFIRYSSIPFDYKSLAVKYHVVFISKPNVAMADTIKDNNLYLINSTYNQFLSADWRVNSASKVLAFVQKKYKVNSKRVVVFGYSEGAQVAARLAATDKKVTHCMAFVGGGLNQFFNEIINYRISAQKNEISHQEAQTSIDSLFNEFQKIYNNPGSTRDFWFGHTYLRWSSFCAVPTIEYLTKLSIPIYIAQGTMDESTSILSSDYIRLEFLRLKKNNLTQRIYPDCDHMFNKMSIVNGETVYENILDSVIYDAINWLNEQK